MKISDLPPADQPREKMMTMGPQALTNAELICLLLRNGGPGVGAPQLAGQVLHLAEGSLARLSRYSPSRFCSIRWVGPDKACSLAAAFELGRRCQNEELPFDKLPVAGPMAIYRLMIPHMKGLQHEECWCIYVNSANYIVAKEMLTSGGLDSTLIDARSIVRRALELNAAAVILVHNHPAGNPAPSTADIRQTEIVREALESMQMLLADHIVVCDDRFYSFHEEKIRKVKP